MRIGELAKKSDCRIETIRYYEREGILPEPQRSASGYRMYRPEHLEELKFIRHCRSLDMPLAEIKALLNFRHHPEMACNEIDLLLERHMDVVKERIAQLQLLDKQLKTLRRCCCEQRTVSECGILQSLNTAADSR
jgi:Cd(II)/Pb(II)-responsive transcriptional regulator